MPEVLGVVLGFDPGGKGRGRGEFGWSVCNVVESGLQLAAEPGLARDAWDAREQVRAAIVAGGGDDDSRVLAAGIDAPLFWGERGNRTVDSVVRRALMDSGFSRNKVSGTVQEVNSLQGACLVQGMLLAKYLWETWRPQITEAHPTALRHLVRQSGHPQMVTMVEHLIAGLGAHERDATLSAVAAWAMNRELPGWRNLYEEESCPVRPFGTTVSYWMPIP